MVSPFGTAQSLLRPWPRVNLWSVYDTSNLYERFVPSRSAPKRCLFYDQSRPTSVPCGQGGCVRLVSYFNFSVESSLWPLFSQRKWTILSVRGENPYANEYMFVRHTFREELGRARRCMKGRVHNLFWWWVWREETTSSSASFFSSPLQSAPRAMEASPNTKKVKRACIKSFRHFDTLGLLKPSI